MDKPGRSVDELLSHIIQWGERIERFIAGKAAEDFLADEILQTAVSKCIEAVGEACGKLLRARPGLQTEHPELDLVEAHRVRNRLSHGYDTIDWLVVWDTATVYIPQLVARIRTLTARGNG
jgi:uncharacterized protein with HEPN domain